MIRYACIPVLAIALALPSCVGIDGSHRQVSPTVGQQLIDLKTALDKGAITPAEYNQEKAFLLAHSEPKSATNN